MKKYYSGSINWQHRCSRSNFHIFYTVATVYCTVANGLYSSTVSELDSGAKACCARATSQSHFKILYCTLLHLSCSMMIKKSSSTHHPCTVLYCIVSTFTFSPSLSPSSKQDAAFGQRLYSLAESLQSCIPYYSTVLYLSHHLEGIIKGACGWDGVGSNQQVLYKSCGRIKRGKGRRARLTRNHEGGRTWLIRKKGEKAASKYSFCWLAWLFEGT